MSDVNDLLGLAIDKNPIDFADTFNNLIQQKQAEALEARRVELAQSMYTPAFEADSDEVDTDDFEDNDDIDLDDDAFEDMDDADLDELDLDDLDLDLDDIDLDLEGITDEDD